MTATAEVRRAVLFEGFSVVLGVFHVSSLI